MEGTTAGNRLVFLDAFGKMTPVFLDCLSANRVTRQLQVCAFEVSCSAYAEKGKRDAWMGTLTEPDEIGHSDGGTHLTILALYLNSGVHAHANCRNGATKM